MQTIPSPPDAALPLAVREFCERRGLLSYLRLALLLAKETFTLEKDPRVTVETDPETDEESVIIDVTSPMPCDEAVERKQRYTRQWVQSVPSDILGKIRLILNIA